MSDKVRVLTEENWEAEVAGSPEPVLVDFWAEWCAPCRRIGPLVEALAEEYAGRVRFGKLDVDENPGLAGRFAIRAIPALLLFRAGTVVDQRLGALPREELVRFVEGSLLKEAAVPAR